MLVLRGALINQYKYQWIVFNYALKKKKPSYITQVDSVHPARAIYKRCAFRIPIESVLRIEDWF